MLIICKSTSNLLSLICFSLFVGIGWSILTVLDYVLEPVGYNTGDIGYLGLIMSLTGTFGGLAATLYLEN